MRQSLDIAIAGAGVAGLAAAAVLARGGHRVVVFERFANSLPLGSGLMLQPTGLAALERLGLRQRIELLGHRIDRLHGITDTNKLIFDLAYADLDPAYYAVAVHRSLLHGVLWDNFKTCGAALETGQTVVGIELQAGGKARRNQRFARQLRSRDRCVGIELAAAHLRQFKSRSSICLRRRVGQHSRSRYLTGGFVAALCRCATDGRLSADRSPDG
jgi:2-polyprenyl-6-methoxyphenol hydroxylase-like FAD-dependent oxidoreductase